MSTLSIYLAAGGIMLAIVTIMWLISLAIRDSSIMDVFWGAGFIIMTWVYFALADGYAPRKLLICVLVTIWGLRLTFYLFKRNVGKGEDFRYAAWRAEAGKSWWWRSFLRVFLLQGFLNWLIGMPLIAIQVAQTPARFTPIDGLAVLVWLVGFTFEALGDYQLTRFKTKPENQGKVMQRGLWRYTRHPNYFGDAVVWWSYGLLAVGTVSTLGFVSLIGPAIMTFFLVKVSGVAMLERTLIEKPGYAQYQATTNAFLPGPPRKVKE